MAITYVGGQVGGRAGATSTTNITYALTGGTNSTPQAGDFVVITVVVGSQARTPACAVTAPATWTNLTQINANGTTYDTSLNVSYKFMGGTPDTTFTLPSTGNIADAQRYTVQVWRGVDTSTPLDVTSVSASGTATGRPNPGSITPTTSGAYVLICGGGAAATGASYTAPANYTTNFLTGSTADTNDAMVGSGYRAWTSGAEDPAAYTGGTNNAVDSWAAYTLALRPGPNNYPLTCQGGSYSLTGQSVTLSRSFIKPTHLSTSVLNLSTSASPGAQSITVPADAQLMVVSWIHYSSPNPNTVLSTLSSTAVGGGFTLVTEGSGSDMAGHAYGYVTSTGSKTITPTWGAALEFGPLFSISYVAGCDTSTPIRDWGSDDTTTDPEAATFNLTTEADDLVIALDMGWSSVPAVPSGWTSLATQTNSSLYGRTRSANTPGSGTTTITSDSTFFPVIAAISIKPPATAGAYTLTANGGTYTLAGGSASLLRSKYLTSSGGSYLITGQNASINRNRKLTSSGGSYSVTGSSVNIYKTKVLVAAGGSYSLNGQSANLLRSKYVIAQGGSYSLSGGSATITWTAGSIAYTLICQGGAYVLTGSAANVSRNRTLSVTGGSYSITGSSAIVNHNRSLTANGGSYSITGNSAVILKSKKLIGSGGSYIYTGQNAVLTRSRLLQALSGNYTLTGSSIVITKTTTGGYPNPSDVLLGVMYGPTGTEYTGTLDIGKKFRIDIATGNIVMIVDSNKVMSL